MAEVERMSAATRRIAVASVVAMAALWALTFFVVPPPADVVHLADRLIYASGWLAVAALFGLNEAVQAVAHERLQTDSFDPLAGRASRRLQVNLRYLQNTLEQFVLHAVGLLGLAAGVAGTTQSSIRAITACSVVWIVSRYLFWIGYHRRSGLRVIGIAGLGQSMIVLMWLSASFGYRYFGIAGLATPLLVLAVIEFILVKRTR